MAGGYSAVPGLYRVPDLLTEERFVEYMKNVYGVDVSFSHPDTNMDVESDDTPVTTLVADRALGQSRPMGVVSEDGRPVDVVDPVLRAYNSAEAVQTSTERRAEEVNSTETEEEVEETDTGDSEVVVDDPDTGSDYFRN